MGLVILVILVLLLFGGGGFGYHNYGMSGGVGIGGSCSLCSGTADCRRTP